MAGHLDTVPANGNATPRLVGDTLWGLGSADMKGGLAVMLELAMALAEPAVDVTYVFYAGEEVGREHNGLLTIAAAAPELLHGDVAVLGEPTNAQVEAGCQGVLKLEVEVGGARAHAARPWMGTNAIHRLAPILTRVDGYQARQPVIDGCRYREALQVVGVTGGVAANVVPDRATAGHQPPLRPGPRRRRGRGLVTGAGSSRSWIENLGDRITVTEAQPAAAPSLGHPVLKALLLATGADAESQTGLDGRGVLRRAWHPRSQLRSG